MLIADKFHWLPQWKTFLSEKHVTAEGAARPIPKDTWVRPAPPPCPADAAAVAAVLLLLLLAPAPAPAAAAAAAGLAGG